MNLFKYTQIVGGIIMFTILTIAMTGIFYVMANGNRLVESKITEKPTPVISKVETVSVGEFEKITPYIKLKDTTPIVVKPKITPKTIETPKPSPKIDTTSVEILDETDLDF